VFEGVIVMITKREKIISKAIEIIKSNSAGIRYSELAKKYESSIIERLMTELR